MATQGGGRIPRGRSGPFGVGGAIGGVGDIYGGIKEKDPWKIGGGVLKTAGAFFPPLAIAGGILSSIGGKKKPSSNKVRTQRVKEWVAKVITYARQGDISNAIGALQQVMGNMMSSASYRKAIQATGEDGGEAWGAVGPIEALIKKLQQGDLTEDPGAQLVNYLTDFVAYLDATPKNSPIDGVRKAAGAILDKIMTTLEYKPTSRETWSRAESYLNQGKPATAAKSREVPKDIQDVMAWEPEFNRGKYYEEPTEEQKGPYGINLGRYASPIEYTRGTPAPAIGSGEDTTKQPLTQQQYYDRSLGITKYRGQARYPAGYDPNVHGTRVEPYQPPQPPAGIAVTETEERPPPVTTTADRGATYGRYGYTPPGREGEPPLATEERGTARTGSRYDTFAEKFPGITPEQIQQMIQAILAARQEKGQGRVTQRRAPPPMGGDRVMPPAAGAGRQQGAAGGGGNDPLARLRDSLRRTTIYRT